MSYIDKIKKNGVIYEIRGSGSGSSSEPSEVVAAVGGNLVYTPAEGAHYQVLDKIYALDQVNTITWNNVVYPLGKSNAEHDFSLFIGSINKENTPDSAVMTVICLLKGAILIDYEVTIEAGSSANTISSNAGNAIDAAMSEISPQIMKFVKYNVPSELWSDMGFTQEMADSIAEELTQFDYAFMFKIVDLMMNTGAVASQLDEEFQVLSNRQLGLMFAGVYCIPSHPEE